MPDLPSSGGRFHRRGRRGVARVVDLESQHLRLLFRPCQRLHRARPAVGLPRPRPPRSRSSRPEAGRALPTPGRRPMPVAPTRLGLACAALQRLLKRHHRVVDCRVVEVEPVDELMPARSSPVSRLQHAGMHGRSWNRRRLTALDDRPLRLPDVTVRPRQSTGVHAGSSQERARRTSAASNPTLAKRSSTTGWNARRSGGGWKRLPSWQSRRGERRAQTHGSPIHRRRRVRLRRHVPPCRRWRPLAAPPPQSHARLPVRRHPLTSCRAARRAVRHETSPGSVAGAHPAFESPVCRPTHRRSRSSDDPPIGRASVVHTSGGVVVAHSASSCGEPQYRTSTSWPWLASTIDVLVIVVPIPALRSIPSSSLTTKQMRSRCTDAVPVRLVG